ncbi:MAG: nucleotide exchange factor GrpE [Anaerolineales bacterium]|nr:nucleotide exchange factor GrpE [Anaerolineales bacterium]
MSDETLVPGIEQTALAEDPPKDIVVEAAEQTAEEAAAEVEPTLEERLELALAESARNMDSFLRAQAEMANARKRYEKQRQMSYVNAQAELIGKLVPVLDDFERAIVNVPDSIREDQWFSGIELVARKLTTILDNMNVTLIEAVGQPFDPNVHEALGQEQSDEYESGIVTREMLKGYQIGSRVIRPSLVYVAA